MAILMISSRVISNSAYICNESNIIPSGETTWLWTSLLGKSTISMGHFLWLLYVQFTRGYGSVCLTLPQQLVKHPLVIEHNYGKSQVLIRKSSNEMGQIPLQILKLPEGNLVTPQ